MEKVTLNCKVENFEHLCLNTKVQLNKYGAIGMDGWMGGWMDCWQESKIMQWALY